MQNVSQFGRIGDSLAGNVEFLDPGTHMAGEYIQKAGAAPVAIDQNDLRLQRPEACLSGNSRHLSGQFLKRP